MRRRLSSLSLFAVATLAASPALAQSWGARLVRTLDSIGASRLVTDKHGKVHVSAVLPPGVSPGALGLVGLDEDTATKVMWPAQVIALGEAHPEIEIVVGPGLKPLLDVSAKWTGAKAFRAQTGFDGKGVIVGIIDTGIDITHPDFRNADGSTRIKWLLQTGIASSGKHKDLEDKYCAYLQPDESCAILDEDEINAALAAGNTAGTFDAEGHGTHVASIAAGNGGVMNGGTPRYVGMAPAADLVVAGMENFGDDDVGWAALFIDDRAQEMGEPVAINVSLGSDYGAHDGSDLLDRRLARLVGDKKPGRAIAVAAGNSGYLYDVSGERWGIHTETRVYPNADVRVPIYAPKGGVMKGYLWMTFDPGDEISVGFEKADGSTWVGPVDPGHENSAKDGDHSAGIVNNKFKPGASLVPPTNGAVLVWDGEWKEDAELAVHLSGHGHAQLWVTTTGISASDAGFLFKRALKQGTVNVPATSPSLLAVGCSINRSAWLTWKGLLVAAGDESSIEPDSTCFFSSAGPTPAGLMKPELTAPGGYVVGAMAADVDPRKSPGGLFDPGAEGCPEKVEACYVADDHHAVAIGTSMSAPHVTGAMALLLQANPKLTQARLTEILQAGARYPQGKVALDSQLGAGELDLMGALQALGQEDPDAADPDPAKSWFVVSNERARPDSSSPIYGTVELRRSNGEIAHALTGDLLQLSVTNGVVITPPIKIRHGLYRFIVAGEQGKSGQDMTIDVTYDGTSLGKKALPLAEDPWSEMLPADAIGGCATSGSSGGAGSAWSVIVAAIAAAALRKQGRRARRT